MPHPVAVPAQVSLTKCAPGEPTLRAAYKKAADRSERERQGMLPANSWAGPEYVPASRQTGHVKAPLEHGLGAGIGPAPVLRAPWGDVGKFPSDAWQADAVAVNHKLERGFDAIRAARAELKRLYAFGYPLISSVGTDDYSREAEPKIGSPLAPGSTLNAESREGLVHRLLHAIMSEAPFTAVLAGHSAAAAHGNHGNQSMTHFLHSALAPALAAVGVELVTRNHAMGGLGSDHRASCFANAFGDDVDLLLWDYAMTAGQAAPMDYLFRQAMLQPRRPVLLHLGPRQHPMLQRYEAVGYHVVATRDRMYGHWASAEGWQHADGLPKITTTSHAQALSLPPGLRYVWCHASEGRRGARILMERTLSQVCEEMRWDCRCAAQAAPEPMPSGSNRCPGQVSWHPGYRNLRITGHMVAALLLDVLEQALGVFRQQMQLGPPPLAPQHWHLAPLLDSQAAAAQRAAGLGLGCEASAPHRLFGCNASWACATEFTPRVGPGLWDIVLRGAEMRPLEGSWTFTASTPPEARYINDFDSELMEPRRSCQEQGHLDNRNYLLGTKKSGWLSLQLPALEHGEVLLNSIGQVSAVGGVHNYLNWGTTNQTSLQPSGSMTIARALRPNLELRVNRHRVTQIEFDERFGSLLRDPGLIGKPVRIDLRVIHDDPDLPVRGIIITHVLWR